MIVRSAEAICINSYRLGLSIEASKQLPPGSPRFREFKGGVIEASHLYSQERKQFVSTPSCISKKESPEPQARIHF